jgi:uncharacterized membrane protein YeaQ/YmgE (transglycosylase-associated protein family)
MTLVEFIILLVISAVAGIVGQQLAGYDLGGLLVSMVLGFVGAVLGLYLARELDLPVFLALDLGDQTFPIVWSVIGSAILAWGIGLVTRGRARLI